MLDKDIAADGSDEWFDKKEAKRKQRRMCIHPPSPASVRPHLSCIRMTDVPANFRGNFPVESEADARAAAATATATATSTE